MNAKVRPLKEEDKSFIYSTWLRGLYHGSDWMSQIDKNSFFANYGKFLDQVLARAEVRVACDPLDEEVIYGYLVLAPGIIHWCHVKEAWRQKGLARLLLGDSKIETVTNITKPGNSIRKKNLWTFDPFKL